MTAEKSSGPARRLRNAARAATTATLVGVLALVGCTGPGVESPTPAPGVTAPASEPSPVATSAPTARPASPALTVLTSPTPTPDSLLATVSHLAAAERLDDRTAADADWPIIALDPERDSPTPTATTVEQTITHVVAKGETLSSIAKARGVSVGTILQANNLTDGNTIAVGQKLTIPTGQQVQISTRKLAAALLPKFAWPANGGFISTYFNEKGPLWRDGWHTGLDIALNKGVPIYAAEAGLVIEAGWATTRGYGNYVKIDHGFGYQTIYGHMSVVRAKVGQYVYRGDRIGDVGSTGVSTGPHLHFELRIDGKEYDPLKYLPKR